VIHAYREVGGDVATLAIGQIVRSSEIWFAASLDLAESEAERWRTAFTAMQTDGTWERIAARYQRLKVQPIPTELRRGDEPLWQQN
jgi:polar amino acid transport system substrate-binding protein